MSFLQPKFWQENNYISKILILFSYVYLLLFRLRFLITTPYQTELKTICIGNVTVGGSGKTPTIIELAKYLISKGKKVCIISRGYKGTINGPVLVDLNFHDYRAVGDEPIIIAKYAPVIISKNKIAGLEFAQKHDFEIALFDDGLQNPSVDYDIKILMLEENHGNNLLLPAGPLREPFNECIKRVDIILSNKDSNKININYDSHHYQYSITCENSLPSGDLVAFAGIGIPQKFFKTIRDAGGNIIEEISFPEHHNFTKAEIENLINIAKQSNAILITTEKDFVRIPHQYKNNITYLAISFKIDKIDKIFENILL